MCPLHRSLLALSAVLSAACHGKLGPEECTRMLDRYVDLSLDGVRSAGDLSLSQAAAAREMTKAIKKAEPAYAKAEAKCRSQVSRDEYDCAMSAKNRDEWEACIE
jgi:hypothetical protein